MAKYSLRDGENAGRAVDLDHRMGVGPFGHLRVTPENDQKRTDNGPVWREDASQRIKEV
jgi:hypothetical protein